MPTDLLKLAALAATAITDAAAGGDWRQGEALITRAHRAAYLAGLSERLRVPLDSALLSERRLSKAERKEIDGMVQAELKYWKAFDQASGDLSEQQVSARAAMYGRATRKTYYVARLGDWAIPPELMPGNQTCLSNCLCNATIKDHGDGTGTYTRALGGTEHHCDQCPALAGDHVVKRRGA